MNSNDEPLRADKDRVIRVFVSSTFSDMRQEREVLVKRIFPQLRKLCDERGVAFTDVDLRWGVSDEQKAEGQVLPICLAEIERCRPFFIGVLGERYGWVPDDKEISDDLRRRNKWLEGERDKSVTELEILHGVLNNRQMSNRAAFYFRDPVYLDRLPAGDRERYSEQPMPEDIERFGPEEAERRAEERSKKLAALKDRIRQGGLPLVENYPDPEAFGQMVLRDLTTAINQEFPAGSEPDWLERQAIEHEAFARQRTVRIIAGRHYGVYIGRQTYFDRLDSYVDALSDGRGLVVVGDSGSGKSALLANWVLRRHQAHPDGCLIVHFIGASADSSDWQAMLRRVLGELKRRFDIAHDIPDKPDELRAAFANWLHMASAQCDPCKSSLRAENPGEGPETIAPGTEVMGSIQGMSATCGH